MPIPSVNLLAISTRAIGVCACVLVFLIGCTSAPTSPPATKTDGATSHSITRLSAADGALYTEALQGLEDGQVEEARKALVALNQRYPDTADVLINLAIVHYQLNDYAAALENIDRAIVLAPDIPASYNVRGLTAVQLELYQEAHAAYSKALELDGQFTDALYNMGLLCDVYFHDLAQAVEHYDRYLALVPEDENTAAWTQQLKLTMSKK